MCFLIRNTCCPNVNITYITNLQSLYCIYMLCYKHRLKYLGRLRVPMYNMHICMHIDACSLMRRGYPQHIIYSTSFVNMCSSEQSHIVRGRVFLVPFTTQTLMTHCIQSDTTGLTAVLTAWTRGTKPSMHVQLTLIAIFLRRHAAKTIGMHTVIYMFPLCLLILHTLSSLCVSPWNV